MFTNDTQNKRMRILISFCALLDKKIQTIKLVRTLSNIGLKEAKDFVESLSSNGGSNYATIHAVVWLSALGNVRAQDLNTDLYSIARIEIVGVLEPELLDNDWTR